MYGTNKPSFKHNGKNEQSIIFTCGGQINNQLGMYGTNKQNIKHVWGK